MSTVFPAPVVVAFKLSNPYSGAPRQREKNIERPNADQAACDGDDGLSHEWLNGRAGYLRACFCVEQISYQYRRRERPVTVISYSSCQATTLGGVVVAGDGGGFISPSSFLLFPFGAGSKGGDLLYVTVLVTTDRTLTGFGHALRGGSKCFSCSAVDAPVGGGVRGEEDRGWETAQGARGGAAGKGGVCGGG